MSSGKKPHVCVAAGIYQLAVARDHEYEPDGQFRHTGTKINGIFVSKTEYDPSGLITREWSEDGSMTETEVNAEGEVVRSTTRGTPPFPPSPRITITPDSPRPPLLTTRQFRLKPRTA